MSQTETAVSLTPQNARDPHELKDIFSKADDLPTLPEVAMRLQELVNNPDSCAADVARLIDEDPAIATKVLKMVNSVFYAPVHGSEIKELQPAIARLGFVTVANIALSTSVFQSFAKVKNPAFDRREFWRHSVCVGIIASILYDISGNEMKQHLTRDVVHLAGIVHDMGKILFERYANEEFHQAVLSATNEDIPVVKEEARFIGMGHDEAGEWLGRRWKLNDEILAVVRWHHDPMACPDEHLRDLVKLIHMADYICHHQGMGESGNPSPSYDHRVREALNMTPDRIAKVMEAVMEETQQSEVLLSLAD